MGSFFNIWSSGQTQIASFTLEHVDPTVQIIAFKVGLHQLQITTQSPQVFNIQVDTGAKLVNPLASKKRWKIQNGLLTTSSGSTNTSFGSNSQDQNNVFRLPNGLKIRLCRALDQPPNATLNDWRALAAAEIGNRILSRQKQSNGKYSDTVGSSATTNQEG